MKPLKSDELETTIRLVQSAQGGSREALNSLFRRYAPRVRRIVALRMNRSLKDFQEIDDVVQNALIKAFKGLRRFEPRSIGTFQNWISTCVQTAILDHFRQKKRAPRLVDHLACPDWDSEGLSNLIFPRRGREPTGSQLLRKKELDDRIEQALLQMHHRYREVITDFCLCEMDYGELAEKMGIDSLETVRTIVHRARRRLKELLEEESTG